MGALLVGDAIHGAVVANTFGATSPAAVLRMVFGLGLIWVGFQVRVDPDEYREMNATPTDETQDADEEFEPELSPVGEEIDQTTHDEEADS